MSRFLFMLLFVFAVSSAVFLNSSFAQFQFIEYNHSSKNGKNGKWCQCNKKFSKDCMHKEYKCAKDCKCDGSSKHKMSNKHKM